MRDKPISTSQRQAEQFAIGLAMGWISKDEDEFLRISGMEATKVIDILQNIANRLYKHDRYSKIDENKNVRY